MARRKRDKILNFRLTKEEYEETKKKMQEGKILYKTYSDYFLKVLNNQKIIINQIETDSIARELNKIGNNINQWTKGINIFNEVNREDVFRLKEEIDKMKKLLNNLNLRVKDLM